MNTIKVIALPDSKTQAMSHLIASSFAVAVFGHTTYGTEENGKQMHCISRLEMEMLSCQYY